MNRPPELVLIDVWSGSSGGPQAIRRLTVDLPGIPIVVCTSRADRTGLWEALDAGANGYLIEPLSGDDLLDALGSLAEGRPAFCRRANELLLASFKKCDGGGELMDILSHREYQVVASLAACHDYKGVAKQLSISAGTVHAHITRIFAKVGVRTGNELIRRYRGEGRIL